MPQLRLFIIFAGFVILISLFGCEDNITVTQYTENRPPKVLLWGTEYDTTRSAKGPLRGPWVLVSDPDGADDIAAVILDLARVTLTSVIVRPDDPSQTCRRPFYSAMDTINILPYLNTSTFNLIINPLSRWDDGVYRSYLTYDLLTAGGLGKRGAVFGANIKTCYVIDGKSLESFGLYPPALSSPRDVFVTYAELSISGMSISVYDQSGEKTSVSFPDLQVIFTNLLEDQTPP